VETRGPAGKRWSPPRPESRWPCKRGKEEKGIHRAVEKAGVDERTIILEQSCTLADGRMRRAVRVATGRLNQIP